MVVASSLWENTCKVLNMFDLVSLIVSVDLLIGSFAVLVRDFLVVFRFVVIYELQILIVVIWTMLLL